MHALSTHREALPARLRLRPDAQLQRLGARAERADRRVPVPGEGRGARAHQPRPAGRGARLPHPARSGVPRRSPRPPRGGRPARAPPPRHPGARGVPAPRRGGVPVLVLRRLGGAEGGHPVGARRRRLARAHLRHGAGLRPAIRRGDVHRADARRLRQGGGRRGAGGAARHRAGPHHLRRRRQLGRPRHAARQQPGRLHDRRLGEQAPRADREAHRAQRQRLQRRRPDPRGGRRLAAGQIRELFESHGLTLHDWEKARTDRITVHDARPTAIPEVA